jgi:putative hydrolase of the HAD superfamily
MGLEGLTLKGVLIDFGGTLAYLDEAENRRYEEALVSTLSKYEYKRYREDLDSVLADIYVSSTKGELKSLQDFWSLVLKKLRIPEQPESIKDLEDVRSDYATRIWKLYDGVPATLISLKKKYKLALVSNCAVGTDKLIDSLDIAHFFRCLILSYQIGARKPDKHIYLEALRCLKLEAYECVFIADEISDLEGAKDLGLKTMLVRQGPDTFKEAKDSNFKPNYECDHIADVTDFL